MSQLEYRLKSGKTIPMFEADYDLAFTVFKKDCRKAKIADPTECIEAMGLCRLRNVAEAYVGGGHDAYVIFKRTRSRSFPHALHFNIASESQKIRDEFDKKGGINRQDLWLRAPADSRTILERRSRVKESVKRRKIASAKGEVTPVRGKRKNRMERIGVGRRRRAVVKAGVVDLFPRE